MNRSALPSTPLRTGSTSHSALSEQGSLPLGDAPADIASLRDAFERSGLPAQGYTFDHAIADETLCRCLANIVEARLRAMADARLA